MKEAWIYALIGGGLIGLSATIHLLFSGRVTGVSGILFGLFQNKGAELFWRAKFIVGLMIGGWLASLIISEPFVNVSGRSVLTIVIAGILVGFGTRLGSGCTSGHGICGISRLSRRSIVATLAFMTAGVVTVTIVSAVSGGN